MTIFNKTWKSDHGVNEHCLINAKDKTGHNLVLLIGVISLHNGKDLHKPYVNKKYIFQVLLQ